MIGDSSHPSKWECDSIKLANDKVLGSLDPNGQVKRLYAMLIYRSNYGSLLQLGGFLRSDYV